MKGALKKDTVREVRHSFGRFLSIFLIVLLGCGFFSGIKATMPDMIATAEEYFSDNRLMDLKLMSSIGVKSEDVEAVKKAENVEGVMAGYSKDVFYYHENQNLVLKFMSFNDVVAEDSPNNLDKPVLLEGRLPEKKGECAVEVKMSSPDTFKVGGKIKIDEPDSSKKITDTLAADTYKIVGIVASPLYIGYERDATTVGNGTVVSNVFVPESEFVCDYYTELYVKFKVTDELDPFSDEYKQAVKDKRSQAVEFFKESVNGRFEKLSSDAQDKITAAEEKTDILRQALSCDESQLTELLKTAQQSVKEAKAAYDKAEQNGSSTRYLARSQLLKAQQLEEVAGRLLDDKKSGSTAAFDEYNGQLAAAEEEIAASKKELESVKAPAFYQYNRFEASSDYSSFYGDAQKVDSIAKVFPVFFILVAALVCLTTMTRMVEEQRTQIGTYKALGYSSARIAGKYLFYAAAAAAAGSCIGVTVGLQLFPKIIYSCYHISYNIPDIDTPFKPVYMILCLVVSVICTCSAVLYACMKELKSQPSQLMRPKPPQNGRRVLLERVDFIWKRLDFLAKVTVRNLLRYKKRFFMTVVGVAGCTALIVTGFGLKYSIKTIADKQFNEVFLYDGIAVLNSTDFDEEQLESKISSIEQVDKFMLTQSIEGIAESGGENQTVSMVVPKTPDSMGDYIDLVSAEDGSKLEVKNGSVIITQKLAKLLDLKTGDTVTVKLNGHEEKSFEIGGVSKNYALHYIYITPEDFESVYGEKPVYNLSFVDLKKNTDENSFKEQLISNDEFYGISFKTDSSRGFLNSVDSLDAIVILLIVCAGGLAFVVLYNLANINITERVREIATIKVLGFYDGETSAYIYRENLISTLVGILVGLGAGKILHYFVVITSEVDLVLFNRQLVWWAYVLGALLTLAFAFIVNLVLHFKLKKIDMVESLKSVE
ncbi:FtsX-like permease family protein [uncultured Ruminococcus sp.]|uniref:FtsX-like permease family protein n=1 Tax=uncultured Ruminococcus sp. TaxID=165186 RepID=UPI00262F053F|nr:FtsX-like permease family protein [uncultured Ruminococcus sp.]